MIRGHLINLGTKNCLDLICPHFEIILCLPNHVIFPILPSETQKCWFLLFLKKSGHLLKHFWIRFLELLSVNHKYLKHLISYTDMPSRMAIVAHYMTENRKVWNNWLLWSPNLSFPQHNFSELLERNALESKSGCWWFLKHNLLFFHTRFISDIHTELNFYTKLLKTCQYLMALKYVLSATHFILACNLNYYS